MPYFSLTTLTITGYGGIVAVDPFARSLANLEAAIGQFYLAITVARLVTLGNSQTDGDELNQKVPKPVVQDRTRGAPYRFEPAAA